MEKRILLVGDYVESLEALRDSLRGSGFVVDTATNPWQAIKTAKEGGVELAVLDLDLPPVRGLTISGWDLVRIFRALHAGMTIIVVAAERGGAVRARAEELNVWECLEKPITAPQIMRIVQSLSRAPATRHGGERETRR